MIKDSDIKEFYGHVATMGLKFPVAAISKATGWNKGNVSQYLSGKQEPSESFLEAFYKAFPKSIGKVSRETNNIETDYKDRYIQLLEDRVNLNEARMLQLLQRNHALLNAISETLPKLVSKLEKIKLLEAHEEMNKRIEHHLDALKKESI